MKFITTALIGGGLIAYSFFVTRFPNPSLSVLPLNLLLAVLLVVLAHRWFGIRWKELGIAPSGLCHGVHWGVLLSVIIATVLMSLAWAKPDAFRCGDSRVVNYGIGLFLLHVLVRIPFGTALAEEVIFRGVLFATIRRWSSATGAIAISALFFGLWHIAPTLALLNATERVSGCPNQTTVLISALIFTLGAGVVFALLRLRTGTIELPILVHATYNAIGLIATYIALSG